MASSVHDVKALDEQTSALMFSQLSDWFFSSQLFMLRLIFKKQVSDSAQQLQVTHTQMIECLDTA